MTTVAARLNRALVPLLVLSLVMSPLLPLATAAAQQEPTVSPWYGRLGYALARVDGGVWRTRALEGFEVAVGRELGASRTVHGALELQGESLIKKTEDFTCPALPGHEGCAASVPDLLLITAAGGLVLQRSIWRVGGFVGPTYVSASDAGRHGGLSMRLQVAALFLPNFALAAGVGTTRIGSLQSTTMWVPRADVSLRITIP